MRTPTPSYPHGHPPTDTSPVCAEIKKIVYPVARCCNINVANTSFFQWLLEDPAYLHVTLYTVSIFFDILAGRIPARATSYHLYRTVKALKGRVGNTKEALTDATAAVVMSLAIVAEGFGDVPAATTHFRGLRRIVEMRGGIDAFKHDSELYSKCCRYAIPLFGRCQLRLTSPWQS